MVSFDVNLNLAERFTSKWKEYCIKTFNNIESHLRNEVEKEAMDNFKGIQSTGLPNLVRYLFIVLNETLTCVSVR
jgi:hypothetical protein